MSTHSSITKVESLTVDDITTMESGDVLSYIKGARRAIKTAEQGRLNATDRAAYATWMAEHTLGVIGKDNKPGKDDIDPGWMTDEAWAASFDKVKSNTGYWRTLGRVLVDLRVDKDGDFYKRLRVSNAYQKPDVKAIVNAETTTPENVEALVTEYLDKHFDEFGKALPAKRTTAGPKDPADKAKTVTEAVEQIKGDDKAKALVIVAALDLIVGRLDIDAWGEVDGALEALRSATNEKFAADLNVAKATA